MLCYKFFLEIMLINNNKLIGILFTTLLTVSIIGDLFFVIYSLLEFLIVGYFFIIFPL
jgi:hypothetical protein